MTMNRRVVLGSIAALISARLPFQASATPHYTSHLVPLPTGVRGGDLLIFEPLHRNTGLPNLDALRGEIDET